jgi:glycine/D-amino acid oxidase-like deaminating enzyme/nitrite reductase/ring-hydroxylating ferredoxin subunit
MNTESYWIKSASLPRFAQLKKDVKVDVAIVGAGITGVTAAYLFKKAGHKVALIDRARCGGFDTSHTTAHLTCVTDLRLHQLVSRFGEDGARAAWEAGRSAIDQIFNNIRAEEIDCEFEWTSAYLFPPSDASAAKERRLLKKDVALSNKLGFPADFVPSIPLVRMPGARFQHQAKFHPLKYLAALVRTIPGNGSYVFENTEVEEVKDKPLHLKVGSNKISCGYVVLATHTPLTGKTNIASATLFQTKLFLYTSYVIGAKLPRASAESASYWDTGDPYDYLRVDDRARDQYAIFGGEDHKTGQITDPERAYRALESRLKALFPKAKIDARWSGQVVETPDGLPFIGETANRQFAATGFAGNGMTFGTLGAMMALDAFGRRKNPWKDLFDIHRKKVSGTWRFVQENKDYPYYLLRDAFASAEGKSLKAVGRNEGKILQLNGKKVAAYCDPHGKISLRSPVCTHLGCIVGWNNAEKTWDCPCHGSRFAPTGEVLSGPAENPLEEVKAEKE